MRSHVRFTLRHALLLITAFCAILGLGASWEYIPGTFHRGHIVYCDSDGREVTAYGVPRGTGKEYTYYDSGAVQCEASYRAGFCYKAIWYRPDGQIVAESSFDGNASGVWYYLDQDGNVKALVPSRYDPMTKSLESHGEAKFLSHDGRLTRIVEYRCGVKVKEVYIGR
jgi:hypothetical protein